MFPADKLVTFWSLNLEIISPNKSGHWIKRYQRDRKNKKILVWTFKAADPKPTAPCIIEIHRVYNTSEGRKALDDDNFIAGCKGIRDTVSSLLVPGLAPGRADSNHGLSFVYQQSKGEKTAINIFFWSV